MYKQQSRFSGPIQKRGKQKEQGWEGEAKQYNVLVGDQGHYYHQHVVIPKSLGLLNLESTSSVLDLGCGQGVFARALPKTVSYVGVDASKSLISFATRLDQNPHHRFEALSVTRPLKGLRTDFSHAICVLALQNMEYPETAIANASSHLKTGGRFLLVLNHPSFRIPRQSGWGEQNNNMQHRWINRYMSSFKIPIVMHPSAKRNTVTMTYHHPLSSFSRMLQKNGFVIEVIEEWCSDKESVGPRSKAENIARKEFPLFMAILARKA